MSAKQCTTGSQELVWHFDVGFAYWLLVLWTVFPGLKFTRGLWLSTLVHLQGTAQLTSVLFYPAALAAWELASYQASAWLYGEVKLCCGKGACVYSIGNLNTQDAFHVMSIPGLAGDLSIWRHFQPNRSACSPVKCKVKMKLRKALK